MSPFGKGVFIGFLKQPHDLVFGLGYIGNIVNFVAYADAVFNALAVALTHIHHHGPPFGLKRTRAGGNAARKIKPMAHGRPRRNEKTRR